ncbi:MAG TPA: tetratricopeptide repeat protein [Burkholderiales bacterium]|nr:tetratricopeptide repeat protein [Burkholderiales bacterium]
MIRWLFRSGRRADVEARAQDTPAGTVGVLEDRPVELGLQHHRAGRLSAAAEFYRQALALDPRHVDALHFLGVVAYQQGDPARAVELISKALAVNAANAPAHNNLGNALAALGRRTEAVHAYLDALALQPEYADALSNLGNALRALDGLDTQAAQARFDEANAHRDHGRLDEALASYRMALAMAPGHAAAHLNLGGALQDQGRWPEALASFRKALALAPDLSEAHYNLGIVAYQSGDLPAAKAALARYLESKPDDRAALMTLAEAHFRSNELDDAARCLERLLTDHPADAAAHNLLANVRRNQGWHAEAIAHYELAIRHDGIPVVAFQNLLFCMMCASGFSAADLHARHLAFARRFEEPLLSSHAPHANEPDPRRRLRIGYVSPEFRANVVGYYLQPILANHDRGQFEIHCYATGSARDEVTGRIASLADQWHDVRRLADEELASLIRSHGIDILVDLCGHGPGNRILAFARKPAPVQVSYLDYSATTGLSSIDYRLTTEYCDPSGVADPFYSERLYRLGEAYWTYNPALRLPIGELPALSNGYATFGSFNLYYRLTGEVLDLWARLLAGVPGSRLLVMGVAAGSTQAALRERMQRAGVERERVSMHDVVSYQKYNELMGTVDVALAPFPYNGATTVMDCLWNGLPVVAMQGRETFTTRLGCSVLAQLGLSELIARDADDYLRIAARLAGAAPALAELRGSLRDRLERSALRDFGGFTRGLERAYRAMWTAWCDSRAHARRGH